MAKQVGIVYHEDFLLHTSNHPEYKGRLTSIMDLLNKDKMFAQIAKIEPTPATVEEVALVHKKEYIVSLEEKINEGFNNLDLDTYLTPHSFRVALLSVGGTLTALREVMSGRKKVCFSLGRPPGHHAEPERGMGFCLFNNIAIAALVAQKEFDLKRILIIDFDVHHGNGTEKVFYDSSNVLFVSVHQSAAYPGTGGIADLGVGNGYGYNINIPLPPGCSDVEYDKVFRHIIIPLADRYEPELIMISAGYDGYRDDPLANMGLTVNGYANITQHIKKIADKHCEGKMVFSLEGGYHLDGLAKSFLATMKVVIGSDKRMEITNQKSSDKNIMEIIKKVEKNIKKVDRKV